MIASCGFTRTEYWSNDYWVISNATSHGCYDRDNIKVVVKTVTQLSLERLKDLMFIPVKVPISRNYNPKHHKLTIRNNLPQRIRLNEKAKT